MCYKGEKMKDKIKEILKGKVHVMDIDSVTEEINIAIFDHFIPVLDLADNRIRNGSIIEVDENTKEIIFLDNIDTMIAKGETLRKMLLHFFWLETSDWSDNE